MNTLRILLVVSMLLLPACTTARELDKARAAQPEHSPNPSEPPAACPVTIPPARPFSPPAPAPQDAPGDEFWYGSNALWTALPPDGIWSELPDNPEGYTQKIAWWREGYVWTEEPEPALEVSGRRLDAKFLPLKVSPATNAYTDEFGSMMLVGVDFPALGCWEITGRYGDTELSFVVWVAP